MGSPVARFERVEAEVDTELLTAAELARRDRLVRPEDRASYVAAHVLVRICAAELLGLRAADVELAQRCPGCGRGDHGAPYVVDRTDVRVSLSHSRGWVAAVAARGRCGIDVELVGRVPDAALTPAERSWAGEDVERRTRLWARKEALAKAGLAELDSFWAVDARAPSSRLVDWSGDGVVGAWVG